MFLNVIFAVNGCDAVPVRAVPHLTGGDIGPLGIAQLLADPTCEITAYEWSNNAAPNKMLPKNWKQFKNALAMPAQLNSDVANLLTTAKLPASVFVYLADLQRVYEEYHLPSRGDLAAYTAAEREDFQLQPLAFIPDDLIDLVFEGFSVPLGIPLPAGSQPTFPSPSVGATAQPTARVTDPERRLIALRALGGEAKWKGRNGGMKWRFTKIKELTEQEKRTKQPRCDEKTIRKDLAEAAEAERMAKRSGATP